MFSNLPASTGRRTIEPKPYVQREPPLLPPPTASTGITCKRPARCLGSIATNASFLVPDPIRKKFADGWNVHVPLTYLTDKYCAFKDGTAPGVLQDLLIVDGESGHITSTPKPLSCEGELTLTFDEWHQAWRRLLQLIKEFLPTEHPLWFHHYSWILNKENRTELWSLYLTYDTAICQRCTHFDTDPSHFISNA